MTGPACGVRRHVDTYVDSVLLLAATRAMRDTEGITWATALMATPANVEALLQEGVPDVELDGASASDLVLAARGTDDAAVGRALAAGDDALFGERAPAASGRGCGRGPRGI